MKKIIISAIIVMATFATSNAQLSSGDKLVGGTIGLNLDIAKQVTVGFIFRPTFDYLLTDNLYLGAHLDLVIAPGGADESGRSVTSTIFSFGPQVGYLIPINDHLYFRNEFSMGFGAVASKFMFDFNYLPTLSLFLSDNFMLNATLARIGYASSKESFSIALLTGTSIGFSYRF